MTYYVYKLIDPRNDAVFYIGKGKGDRISAHEREALAGRLSAKCDVIRAIQSAGQKVVKKKVRTFSNEQDAYDYEADLIWEHGVHNLTNIVPGGGTARDMPTMSGDRGHVKIAAFMLSRTRNGTIRSVTMFGRTIELGDLIDAQRAKVVEVIKRRGIEWVNEIALRSNVQFVHA